jgi:hypothetical protein
MPLPVLAVFSGVLSKVAAYGFLRIVTPLLPDASVHFQELMLLIGLASILYGSAMAFTTTSTRLILGYSSVAQLGFILLGIFALNRAGAQGACCSRSTTARGGARVLRRGAARARAAGSEDVRDMGGIALRAPVLATMFLIVALANLAMPGSSNFAGEFLILLGVFETKIVIAIVAFTGVVLASVYTLRLFIRAMHNRVGPAGRLARPERARRARARPARRGDHRPRALPAAAAREGRARGHGLRPRGRPDRRPPPTAQQAPGPGGPMILAQAQTLKGPAIDWAALSPIIAVLIGAIVVLMTASCARGSRASTSCPFLSFASLAVRWG